MTTIKPIEGTSVHQIQSGQVIVDLCSVVKELVENSLDAGATSIDVRLKNNGLDSIEVQDNGDGIAPEDYETIALKHYTSKLSTYDDLTSLQTFGFRGEALSSLCAVSNLHITTARPGDAPKGTRLDFETSGKLKSTTVVASPKGTTVAVEALFRNLPVRRRELEKNIKREYSKVLNLLHAYACISVCVRYSVSNQVAKGKKVTAFSTKCNTTVRENIANVYGAKTLPALLPLDLKFGMEPRHLPSQSARVWSTHQDPHSREIHIIGHISRPVFGEGRQTPDRQLFFVNARPCALPQVAKAFNEVYKSYNVSQSPFILADLKMDTNAYDVNVSPDKRTILLHDQSALLDSLKLALTQLFDSQAQTVPLSHTVQRLPAFRQLSISREASIASIASEASTPSVDTTSAENARVEGVDNELNSSDDEQSSLSNPEGPGVSLIKSFAGRNVGDRTEHTRAERGQAIGNSAVQKAKRTEMNPMSKEKQRLIRKLEKVNEQSSQSDIVSDEEGEANADDLRIEEYEVPREVQDCNDRIASQQAKDAKGRLATSTPAALAHIAVISTIPQRSTPGIIQSAFDRMRPKRTPAEVVTITIGDKSTLSTIGSPVVKKRRIDSPRVQQQSTASPLFGNRLRAFAAPGTHTHMEDGEDDDVDTEEGRDGNTELEGLKEELRSLNQFNSDEGSQEGGEENVGLGHAVQSSLPTPDEDDSASEYFDEKEKKAREEARVAQLIHEAEEAAALASEKNVKRASDVMKGRSRNNSTLNLLKHFSTSVARIEAQLQRWTESLEHYAQGRRPSPEPADEDQAQTASPEERLSLAVSKADFARMRVVGQFNLGFILVTRPTGTAGDGKPQRDSDELFIIDQHASDEKRNFERLQAETVVQSQPLVQPRILDLTAIEEETILSHPDALSKNGFIIEVDTSGNTPVGRRCRLLSLPMSREVVFDTRDLEELLTLLLDSYTSNKANDIPRPSKVRRMFAMRACRSSIMVGKTLTMKQMEDVVRRMGEIDKPWNCPHGRPTMRHLMGMGMWTEWKEGDSLVGMGEIGARTDWTAYIRGNGNVMRGEDEGVEDTNANANAEDKEV